MEKRKVKPNVMRMMQAGRNYRDAGNASRNMDHGQRVTRKMHVDAVEIIRDALRRTADRPYIGTIG